MDLILFLVFYVKESKHQLLADLTVHLAHLFHSRNATSLCFITSYFIQSSCVALTIPLPPPGCPHLSRPFYCILLLYIGHYCTSLKSPLVVSEMNASLATLQSSGITDFCSQLADTSASGCLPLLATCPTEIVPNTFMSQKLWGMPISV